MAIFFFNFIKILSYYNNTMVENIIKKVLEIGVSVILFIKISVIPFLRKYVEKRRKRKILTYVLDDKGIRIIRKR